MLGLSFSSVAQEKKEKFYGSNFKGVSSKRNLFISKASIGVEYYLFETVALTFETSHLYHWQRMDFFKENSNGLMWSIGITTTLF